MDIDKYLSSFFKGTKDLNLKAMTFLMNELNHPEKHLKIIHIAGTNGKGSVTEMISNVLINEGYCVGKFISPHLVHYNERISINNVNISDNDFEKLINRLIPLINKYNSKNETHVTLFELLTTIALLYFNEKKCDFVVLETGLGGLNDSTNIVNNTLISVITSIGYDHMRILGNTLEKIAYQKAGIIKNNYHTVLFNQTPEINDIFISECKKKNNKLHIVNQSDIYNYYYDNNFQHFSYKNYKNIPLNLKGRIQIQNASICLETFFILKKLGFHIHINNIKKGLKTIIHKGRMETLHDNPTIIYDGAHNEQALNNLQKTIKMYYLKRKRTYIVSILKRKNYISMLKTLAKDKNATFILTSGNNSEKYVSKEELFTILKKYINHDRIYKKDLENAILDSLNNNNKTVTFIIGSLYTYNTVIKILNK